MNKIPVTRTSFLVGIAAATVSTGTNDQEPGVECWIDVQRGDRLLIATPARRSGVVRDLA